jgi:hypothetical protein
VISIAAGIISLVPLGMALIWMRKKKTVAVAA